MDVRVTIGDGINLVLKLREDETPTVRALLSSLPFSSKVHRWGDEVYFEAPFHAESEEDARQDMEVGEVAFWPAGDALAIFFGRTPVSTSDKPRAYSPCNVVGSIHGDVAVLRTVDSGTAVKVEK